MNIIFERVILHNFLSYGDSDIYLKEKHYCLVSGINNDPRDNALSNGSGKSTWSSAICWALTGQTIQGLSSNIKNVNIPEDSCYVTLYFSVDNDSYKITRIKNPKSDLKIELNGTDISGKGIRESEIILAKNIPDLSSQLIASIIILGQGLPYKFSDNSPSGRKEVLEKLSKSDFMIQDLKDRINLRFQSLSEKLRTFEDKILSDSSQKNLLQSQIESQKLIVEKYQVSINYDAKISEYELECEEIKNKLAINSNIIMKEEEENSKLNESLTLSINEKNKFILDENNQFNDFKSEYLVKKSDLKNKINNLESEIYRLKNIKDICPTCGQKIPNVIKPDTSELELSLKSLNEELNKIELKYTACFTEHQKYVSDISDKYEKDISNINFSIKKVKEKLNIYNSDITIKSKRQAELFSLINTCKLEKQNFLSNKKDAENKLSDLEKSVKKLSEEILYNNNEKNTISNHISILNQMNTLIKRDFRGFLLSNIIKYICLKSKEYCLDVFGNDKLEFSLDGNNINISYCDKSFENLSGGEKQRVDLIIQFAIRDMMKQYLGFSSNILILDEIFDQLDSTGCTNILNLISKKLNDIESVFIISHRAGELEIPYDSELIVIKNEEGVSSIRWQ